jgi:hypothetical protein
MQHYAGVRRDCAPRALPLQLLSAGSFDNA